MEIEYFIFNYWYKFFMVLLKNLSYIVIDLDLGFLSPDPDRQKNPDPKHCRQIVWLSESVFYSGMWTGPSAGIDI